MSFRAASTNFAYFSDKLERELREWNDKNLRAKPNSVGVATLRTINYIASLEV